MRFWISTINASQPQHYISGPIDWTLGLAFTFCHFDPEQWLSSLQDWPKLWADYLVKNNFLKNEQFSRFFFKTPIFLTQNNDSIYRHFNFTVFRITSNMWASPPLPPWLGAQVSPYFTRMLSTSDLLLYQYLDRGILSFSRAWKKLKLFLISTEVIIPFRWTSPPSVQGSPPLPVHLFK